MPRSAAATASLSASAVEPQTPPQRGRMVRVVAVRAHPAVRGAEEARERGPRIDGRRRSHRKCRSLEYATAIRSGSSATARAPTRPAAASEAAATLAQARGATPVRAGRGTGWGGARHRTQPSGVATQIGPDASKKIGRRLRGRRHACCSCGTGSPSAIQAWMRTRSTGSSTSRSTQTVGIIEPVTADDLERHLPHAPRLVFQSREDDLAPSRRTHVQQSARAPRARPVREPADRAAEPRDVGPRRIVIGRAAGQQLLAPLDHTGAPVHIHRSRSKVARQRAGGDRDAKAQPCTEATPHAPWPPEDGSPQGARIPRDSGLWGGDTPGLRAGFATPAQPT